MGTPAKRHSNVRGHKWRHRESLLQAWAAPLKMDSSSPIKHTDFQQHSRSRSIWKAKTKHISLRSKRRLNPSPPFSFKIQVYRVVSGRSKAPCPPPPAQGQARSRQDSCSARKLCFNSVDISPPHKLRLFSYSPSPECLQELYKME